MIRAIVSLSGGMDSTTLLGEVLANGREVVEAVGFSYGSKHNSYENLAAMAIAEHYGVPFRLIDLTEVFRGFPSALMKSGDSIPEGHYEAETMRQTVVPGRNMIFASILAGIAESRQCREVFMGVHAGDHAIYPDCRPEFAVAMAGAMVAATDGKVTLAVPFIRYHKEHILARGFQIGVPYEKTRTCYKDQPIACGKCGSCQERLAAFDAIGGVDPIEYESRELFPVAG